MDHDFLSKIIGLMRYANVLGKLSGELRSEIYLLEKEVKEMIQRHWSYIMLHHSLTKDGQTVSWQAIRRYHMETLGWRAEGYHFGIELINDQYEILVGRPLDMEGAHCSQQNMNRRAIGICFVGNFDIEPVPPEQWQKGIILVTSLVKLLDIPQAFIVGHRNFAPKTCPGKLFDLGKFRQEVAQLL